jgi:hypothetical protein
VPPSRISAKKIPTQADREKRMSQHQVNKRQLIIRIAVGALIVVVVAAAVGVAVALTRKKGSSGGGGGGGSSNGGKGGGGTGSSSSTSGKTGSKVTLEDGSTFIYTNDFGGNWVYDPKNPFGHGGQAQSWTPRVGQDDWVWGQDVVKGVNLGYVRQCPL